MARKKASAPSTTITAKEATVTIPEVGTATEALDAVKVNNANITELKIALDDAVRRFFARPEQFRTRHTHTDVRLGLGWLSVLVASATGFYGWKKDFEESKPLVLAGVILYFVLSAVQTAYTYYVEDKTIFVGKRKTLAHRIENEYLKVASATKPATQPVDSPEYALTLSYVRSHGGGKAKTIIRKTSSTEERLYTAFYDEEGTLDELAFIAWLSEFCESLISSDEIDGVKLNEGLATS